MYATFNTDAKEKGFANKPKPPPSRCIAIRDTHTKKKGNFLCQKLNKIIPETQFYRSRPATPSSQPM